MKFYKQWLKYSISLILVIIFFISIFNYKIDSLGIFGNSNYLSKAAKALTNGEMIAGLDNYDQRLFQELIIRNLQIKNDVIVIGSSRAMLLRKRFFLSEDKKFFNHSTPGASLEDYISIIGAYESIRGYIPSTVILAIDPWIFNKNSRQTRWKTLKTYYNYEMDKISGHEQDQIETIDTLKWKQLFNYDFTISNINFFISTIKNKNIFYATDTIEIDDSIKEPDGSVWYPYKKRYPDDADVKRDAIKHTKFPVYALEEFHTLGNMNLFENFIKYLKSKNIRIIFILPPYHPVRYDILTKNDKFKNLVAAEEYLKDFSSKNTIPIFGSYNPHKLNLTNKNFYDGRHPHDFTMENIVSDLNITIDD